MSKSPGEQFPLLVIRWVDNRLRIPCSQEHFGFIQLYLKIRSVNVTLTMQPRNLEH